MSALKLSDVITRTDDIVIGSVDVPEWGGTVYVKTLTGDARDKLDDMYTGTSDRSGMRAAIVAYSWCDEEGNTEDITPEDVDALGQRSGAALDRVCEKCIELSELGVDAIEGAVKN